MMQGARFKLVFAPETVGHLGAIDRSYYRLIRSVIHEQLTHAPQQVTRSRKPLERPGPFGATWELRFGPGNRFRVFYEVNIAAQTVVVLAIGAKERNRLYIGGEELEL